MGTGAAIVVGCRAAIGRILGAAPLLFCLVAPSLVQGHEDVDSQIAALTARIAVDPANAVLFLRRGELHRVHGDRQAALDDYEQAARLDPDLTVVDLVRGKLYLHLGQPRAARIALDRFLARQPDHSEGHLARARALVKLGKRPAAVADFTHAIALETRPRPDAYLERAQALADEGERKIDEALRGLDEGIAKLGPLVVLELYASDLELRRRRHGAALARLDRVAAQSARKETWLARRSEILELSGRREEGREAAAAALAAIEALPPRHRMTPAMVELESRVRASLERLSVGRSHQTSASATQSSSRATP
jgi:predicted Zn-dependent protease